MTLAKNKSSTSFPSNQPKSHCHWLYLLFWWIKVVKNQEKLNWFDAFAWTGKTVIN
ncbi:hypothetical protein CDL12_27145 [Handroanthus impetiginosus]|uniref:Uncharacterized protein n=1 Tax=Handroanthus impetiginosus TaxID=429701 RepID=A0A2G9G581_9LAMI|nr:hypothetical protein CDL12_27145 [Handroanthus impetiginosus]